VALVHDWLIGGGAERVVEQLHKMYPEAPIYTSCCSNEWRQKLDGKVVTGYLQHWPFSQLRKFLPPLRGLWFSHLDLSAFDLVISSSGAEAKFIKTRRSHIEDSRSGKTKRILFRKTAKLLPTTYDLRSAKAVHISYIHAPTHYYWSRYDDYMRHPGFGKLDPLARLGLKVFVRPMRRWDFRAAQRPDYLIANSTYTKEQIEKYYGRDAVVIHPPVETKRFKILNKSSILRHGFVIAGRQTPYKRMDLAVRACSRLKLPLLVLGDGPEHRKLKKLAGRSITFIKNPSDEQVADYFKSSLAFIFPGLDDFGVVAVEAMAAGTPVIAYEAGGALDYVEPGKTGLFFEPQTVEALEKALQKFKPANFNNSDIQKAAGKFSGTVFANNFQKYISQVFKNQPSA
jgi:glycosyltransferase involved in cell wall biosynthesis